MPAFPRGPKINPNEVSPFGVPTGLISTGQTGKDQTRGIVSMGRSWEEQYKPMKRGEPETEAFLAFIEAAWNRKTVFTILHRPTPGSGRAPNGAGGGVPLVNGANQHGASLITDGWSHSVPNIVRAGDVIRVAGISPLLRIMADADSDGSGNAMLTIDPQVPIGAGAADNAAITRTGCVLNARIAAAPNLPKSGWWLVGLTLKFHEAL